MSSTDRMQPLQIGSAAAEERDSLSGHDLTGKRMRCHAGTLGLIKGLILRECTSTTMSSTWVYHACICAPVSHSCDFFNATDRLRSFKG